MDVMHQLEFLTTEVHSLRDAVTKLDKDTCLELGLIKQKASIWGAVWGMIASAAISVIATLIIHAVSK